MDAFVAVAALILPDILKYFSKESGKGTSDELEKTIAAVIRDVTGEQDAEAAKKKLASEPDTMSKLRDKLLELSSWWDHANKSSNKAVQPSASGSDNSRSTEGSTAKGQEHTPSRHGSTPSDPSPPVSRETLQTPKTSVNNDSVDAKGQNGDSGQTSNFQACVKFVLKNEGGYVDNPEDPGGATNMGITIDTLRAWRGKPVTVDDVRHLTEAEAEQIYKANYWDPLKCDKLPKGVDMVVFDFGVNAGVRRSAMTLQRVVGVSEDGDIGPATIAATAGKPPQQVVSEFGSERLNYYRQLKEWPEFGRGWTDRETECQSEARSLMS